MKKERTPEEQSIIDDFAALHAKYRDIFLKAKVKEVRYNKLLKTKDVAAVLLQTDLINSCLSEIKTFTDIYNLIPESMWHNYEAFNISDLTEQKMLDVAAAKLRNKFYSGLSVIKKERKTKHENKQDKHQKDFE